MIDAAEFRAACVCQSVRRAARAVSRRYEAALRPVNLKAGQFSILAALNRPTPTAMVTLAADLGLDRTTLTRDLAPLARRDLVAVTPSKDRRVRAYRLTNAGQALLAEAEPLWRAAQADSAKRVPAAEWATLRHQLDRL